MVEEGTVVEDARTLVQRFKNLEEAHPERIHPLITDEALRNLVVAWETAPITFSEPKGALPEDENSQWQWLWSQVQYDRDYLAYCVKIQSGKLGGLIDRAKAFRLIYPDGSANKNAIQFIRNEIAKTMQSKTRAK
jgi:hypothetical protein